MSRTAILLALATLLAACGDDQSQSASTSAPPAPAAAASTAAPPADAATESMPAPAMAADDEIQYDPIDVSKLDNAWWRQYSSDANDG